jgi:hypothetical protein
MTKLSTIGPAHRRSPVTDTSVETFANRCTEIAQFSSVSASWWRSSIAFEGAVIAGESRARAGRFLSRKRSDDPGKGE